MPIPSSIALAPSPRTRRLPREAPPSWRVGRHAAGLGRARTGRKALSALLPARALQHALVRLAREAMLGAVIGILGGWGAAMLAIRIGL